LLAATLMCKSYTWCCAHRAESLWDHTQCQPDRELVWSFLVLVYWGGLSSPSSNASLYHSTVSLTWWCFLLSLLLQGVSMVVAPSSWAARDYWQFNSISSGEAFASWCPFCLGSAVSAVKLVLGFAASALAIVISSDAWIIICWGFWLSKKGFYLCMWPHNLIILWVLQR